MIPRALWFTGSLVLWSTAFGQRSPFNGLDVLPADSTGHYRILIGGHFHGASTNKSGYPAATLLANLDTINVLGANLFLSTGDLFMDPVKDWPRYERALFSKLKMPFFNAPGNHDVTHGVPKSAEELAAFVTSPRDRVLVLNTEPNGVLAAEELQVFKWVQQEHGGVKNFFIFSHRPIWAEDDPQYSLLFEGNTRSLTGTNFKQDVYPLLEKIAEHAHVYWISGSMGGQAPSSIFFQEHAKNITYIQCAIRDEARDALLIADVYPDTVKWSALSLTGQTLLAPESYNADWWRKNLGKSEGFNWRLLPYLVKSIVTHRAFWWGSGVTLLIIFLARRIFRKRPPSIPERA